MGLREELLDLEDREVLEVVVPEWGGRTVRVGSMTAADRDRHELEIYQAQQAGQVQNVRAKMVARCVVDAAGQRVFADADIERLGQKNGKALDRLYDACIKVNRLTAAEAEQLAKN